MPPRPARLSQHPRTWRIAHAQSFDFLGQGADAGIEPHEEDLQRLDLPRQLALALLQLVLTAATAVPNSAVSTFSDSSFTDCMIVCVLRCRTAANCRGSAPSWPRCEFRAAALDMLVARRNAVAEPPSGSNSPVPGQTGEDRETAGQARQPFRQLEDRKHGCRRRTRLDQILTRTVGGDGAEHLIAAGNADLDSVISWARSNAQP